jgi:hypothetical protein
MSSNSPRLQLVSWLTDWLTPKLLLALASTVTFCSESNGTHDQILLSQIRDSPNLEGQIPVFISPGTGWPSYTTRHWVTFSSPPTTLRATEEVLEPASTRGSVGWVNCYWPSPAVIPGFSLLEIHDQDFYSVLDMYVFRNGACSSTKEGSVFLCRRYICCTVVQHEYIRTVMASRSLWTLSILCHCTILSTSNICLYNTGARTETWGTPQSFLK